MPGETSRKAVLREDLNTVFVDDHGKAVLTVKTVIVVAKHVIKSAKPIMDRAEIFHGDVAKQQQIGLNLATRGKKKPGQTSMAGELKPGTKKIPSRKAIKKAVAKVDSRLANKPGPIRTNPSYRIKTIGKKTDGGAGGGLKRGGDIKKTT